MRKFDGHQAEQADSMLPIEAMQYSVNKIGDVSPQCEHYAEKLWDRNKHVAKYFSMIRSGGESETITGTHMRMAAIPSELGCQEQTQDKLYAGLHTDAEHIISFDTDTLLMFDVTRKQLVDDVDKPKLCHRSVAKCGEQCEMMQKHVKLMLGEQERDLITCMNLGDTPAPSLDSGEVQGRSVEQFHYLYHCWRSNWSMEAC